MKARNALIGVSFFAMSVLILAPAQAQPASAGRVTSENRLFLRFVEDAALVPSYWLEGQARFQQNTAALVPGARGPAGEASLLTVGPVFAMNVVEDFEFGARIATAFRDPERGGSDAGLTDLDLWGKISVVTDPVKVALGILVTAPTGDEDKALGTGETNVEFFGGIRKDFSSLTIAGNAGVRINQDPDIDGLQLEGKNSLLAGAAVLFPAGRNLVLSVEYALETERIDGLKNDSRLFGGFEYRQHQSFLIRGGLGGGLSDGAPDFEATGSAVWLF